MDNTKWDDPALLIDKHSGAIIVSTGWHKGDQFEAVTIAHAELGVGFMANNWLKSDFICPKEIRVLHEYGGVVIRKKLDE